MHSTSRWFTSTAALLESISVELEIEALPLSCFSVALATGTSHTIAGVSDTGESGPHQNNGGDIIHIARYSSHLSTQASWKSNQSKTSEVASESDYTSSDRLQIMGAIYRFICIALVARNGTRHILDE
jgi:hypothetical protein